MHTLNVCTDSSFHFPTGQYQGLTICIDLQKVSAYPPELIADAEIFDPFLRDKFHLDDTISFLAGNGQSEHIFSAFYDQPEKLRLPYQRIKVLGLLLYLAKADHLQRKFFAALAQALRERDEADSRNRLQAK